MFDHQQFSFASKQLYSKVYACEDQVISKCMHTLTLHIYVLFIPTACYSILYTTNHPLPLPLHPFPLLSYSTSNIQHIYIQIRFNHSTKGNNHHQPHSTTLPSTKTVAQPTSFQNARKQCFLLLAFKAFANNFRRHRAI